MQVDTAQFRMADRLAGGKLAKILRKLDADGMSPRRISKEVYATYGIDITQQTVRSWLGKLNSPDEAAS